MSEQVMRFDCAGCIGYCYGGYHMKEDKEYGDYIKSEDHDRIVAALEAERDALRKAAKGFYNATVAQPALRMSSASKQIVDDAEEAGERLRALIVEPTAAIAAKEPK